MNAWIDGELPPAEASALETHVATCADCRVEAEKFARCTRTSFARSRTRGAAAARAAERAVAGLAPAAGKVARTEPRWSHVISLGLALAIGFLLAVFVFRPWKSPAPATGAAGTSTNSHAAALLNPTHVRCSIGPSPGSSSRRARVGRRMQRPRPEKLATGGGSLEVRVPFGKRRGAPARKPAANWSPPTAL